MTRDSRRRQSFGGGSPAVLRSGWQTGELPCGVSLSVTTWSASLPIAFRLYLPEVWTEDKKRRSEVGIPEEVQFQTKPQIALGQIRVAVEELVAW